ncbi:MAG: hypothetical protein ACTHM0_04320 [Sphingomonas sp.]
MHESPSFEFIPNDGSNDDALPLPDFTPVPLTRRRHDGWTAERQRAFIAALAETGMIAAAARAAGMGVTSAYNLRRRPGAESFARAWTLAETDARRRAYELILEQALCGTTRPRFYRGRFVSTVHALDTRLALAALRVGYRPK